MTIAAKPAQLHPFDRRQRALQWVLEHEPFTLTYEQENILMYGTPDVLGWATDLPRNEGIPTKALPDKCSACKTPIWRWSARLRDWVCVGCKVHDIKHLRKDGDLSTLDGCIASGVYKSNHTNGDRL